MPLSAAAAALAGGVLIGAAASLLLLFNGRLAGAAGILGMATYGLLQRQQRSTLPAVGART